MPCNWVSSRELFLILGDLNSETKLHIKGVRTNMITIYKIFYAQHWLLLFVYKEFFIVLAGVTTELTNVSYTRTRTSDTKVILEYDIATWKRC